MRIAIDAGHYLGTPGKRCLKSIDPAETREWVLNGRIADYLTDMLSQYRDVEILRMDDPSGQQEVTLFERVGDANAWGADFYLSIHHNAGIKGGSGGGVVAYVAPGVGSDTTGPQKALYEAVVAATDLRGNRARPLAEADYYVLEYTKMPAVLMELGFMDSTTDTPIILTETFARRAALGLLSGLVEYYGLRPVEAAKDPGYEQFKGYMERYRRELAQQPATMPDLVAEAKALGLTDGSRPRDFCPREEAMVMALVAAKA